MRGCGREEAIVGRYPATDIVRSTKHTPMRDSQEYCKAGGVVSGYTVMRGFRALLDTV